MKEKELKIVSEDKFLNLFNLVYSLYRKLWNSLPQYSEYNVYKIVPLVIDTLHKLKKKSQLLKKSWWFGWPMSDILVSALRWQ